MMKKLIVYQSKTGFTKRYAKWIQETIKADSIPINKADKKLLKKYDIIIFGSYIRMEKVRGLEKIWNMGKSNPKQNCIFFATGATAPANKKQIETIWERSISKDVLRRVPHFYMQSGINDEKLNTFEKSLMSLFRFFMKLWGDKSDKNMGVSFDASSKGNIDSLVECVKGLEASKSI